MNHNDGVIREKSVTIFLDDDGAVLVKGNLQTYFGMLNIIIMGGGFQPMML